MCQTQRHTDHATCIIYSSRLRPKNAELRELLELEPVDQPGD